MGSRGLRCLLLQRLIVGTHIHSASAAAVPPPWTASTSSGGRAQFLSSGTSFLFGKYADSPENLVELMRRIVRRGGRGRKQDNVPKEVRNCLCCTLCCVLSGLGDSRGACAYFVLQRWVQQ